MTFVGTYLNTGAFPTKSGTSDGTVTILEPEERAEVYCVSVTSQKRTKDGICESGSRNEPDSTSNNQG